MEPNETCEVVWAMRKYGGGFVKALGEALNLADLNNQERLKKGFPDYWSQYRKIGKERHLLEMSHVGEFHCQACSGFFAEPKQLKEEKGSVCPICDDPDFYLVDGGLRHDR